MLSRDQILAAKDGTFKTVTVPEWGGDIGIRVMSVGERLGVAQRWLEASKSESGAPALLQYEFLAAVLCDGDGRRIFSDDDVEALMQKSGDVLDRLVNLAVEYNGLGGPDDAENEIEGKEPMPSGDSPGD